jgi:hypothetical protein
MNLPVPLSCYALQNNRLAAQLTPAPAKRLRPLCWVQFMLSDDVVCWLLLLQVEAEGRHSSWNVDGELLRDGRVNVGIHAGLVDVFARGVELM